jgi:hypothetical protein
LYWKNVYFANSYKKTGGPLFLFIYFYSNMGKGKDYKGGSLPLLNMIEEMKGEIVGMLPNTRWEAAHSATKCASILAHLEVLRALQTFIECN